MQLTANPENLVVLCMCCTKNMCELWCMRTQRLSEQLYKSQIKVRNTSILSTKQSRYLNFIVVEGRSRDIVMWIVRVDNV